MNEFWTYDVIEVCGVAVGMVEVGEQLIDSAPGEEAGEIRQWNIMRDLDPEAGAIVGQAVRRYDGPFDAGGRPCSEPSR